MAADGSAVRLGVVTAMPAAPEAEGPAAAPLDDLAGLPLALRAVLTLQKEGVQRVLLVVAPDDRLTPARVRGDARVRVPVEAVTWESLRDRVDEPFVLASHDVVADPAIYRELMRTPLGPGGAGEPGGPVAIIAVRRGKPIGPMIATRELLGQPEVSLEVMRASAEPQHVIALDVGDAWCERVDTPEGRRRAFRALFEACRKPMDGVISRNLNRHISIFVSKRIVGLPITPNMLSVFTFLLGVAGAICCAFGTYGMVLLGAFLFQWNSILDGVDGELARVRFQHSKLGQWLDTVSDDVSNLVFYAGLAAGAGSLPFGRELQIAAGIGIVASCLATAQYYVEMVEVGSGDLYAIDWGFDKAPPPGLRGKLLLFSRTVLKKDFAIFFFLVLALFGVLPYALVIVAVGAVSTLVAATGRNLRRRRARASAAPGHPAA